MNPGKNGVASKYRERYISQCLPLHKAALKGDWDVAKELLYRDPSLITAPITERGETVLHIAAVEGHAHFVTCLQTLMDESHYENTNSKGCTALTFAAAAGHVDIAKMMTDVHPILPAITGPNGGVTPLFMAALMGRADVADYLFPLSKFEQWPQEDQIRLLNASIQSRLYGLASQIVSRNNNLSFVVDDNGDTPLAVLAKNPSFFRGDGGPVGFSQSVSNKVVSWMKLKLRNSNGKGKVVCDAYALFHVLWDAMIAHQDIEAGEIYDYNTCCLVFIAAEVGNYPFLVELIRRDPVFLYKINHNNHSIFHIAVKYRHVDIFNLIYEVIGMKDLMATYVEQDTGNNMLHLAAIRAPQHKLDEIPGATLQMQHELLWYKEVEKIVQPLYRNMKNLLGQTPHELFLMKHRTLMKEGEKELKYIAKSFMLVTMLITTVVFAAAFTVPGGYDNITGDPILRNRKKMFAIFPICEGVATLSSLASMLMFLSILTSRYAERDFLTLPLWLVNGVMALLVSIVAMVGAMCSSILFYETGRVAGVVLIMLFTSVPLMFVGLKYQLLVSILKSCYGGRCLFRSNYCLLS